MYDNLQDSLESVVSSSGQIRSVYGGFEITVTEPSGFPWERVFELLVAFQMSVWVEKRDARFIILSKPPPI